MSEEDKSKRTVINRKMLTRPLTRWFNEHPNMRFTADQLVHCIGANSSYSVTICCRSLRDDMKMPIVESDDGTFMLKLGEGPAPADPAAVKGVMIAIEVEDNKTLMVSVATARKIHATLKELFG